MRNIKPRLSAGGNRIRENIQFEGIRVDRRRPALLRPVRGRCAVAGDNVTYVGCLSDVPAVIAARTTTV